MKRIFRHDFAALDSLRSSWAKRSSHAMTLAFDRVQFLVLYAAAPSICVRAMFDRL
jgi:hypothetical protein